MRPTHRARGGLTERCRRRAVAVTLLAGGAACAGTRGAVAAPAWEAGAQQVTLETDRGTLHGTLELPAPPAGGRVPVVLIISGSGPTDRDGNSAALAGRNDGLKQLAESLASRGIASVRYDKRGLGASAPAAISEAELRFDDMVADAAGWLRQLRRDARFGAVAVAGHSEGSLVGMLAARDVDADGYASLAGLGQPAYVTLRRQLAAQLPPPMLEEVDTLLAHLVAGRTAESPPMLAALFRASVQPYLISWFRHDPAGILAELRMPVLIVQGTTDLQVSLDEARALHAARSDATLLVIEGMNHVLKPVGGTLAEQLPSYGQPDPAVHPTLVEGLASFVAGLQR